MQEIWKDIRDYEGLYQISDNGNVKSLGRWVNSKNKGKRWKKEKIMKSSVDKEGYLNICLWKNRKLKCFRVHRLVYEAFYVRIPKGMQVNHINEVKSDNRLENLNLMTPKENCNYGTRNERIYKKTTNGKCSKPILQIDIKTNEIIKEFPSTREVERQLGLTHISKCCNGKLKTCGGYKWRYK